MSTMEYTVQQLAKLSGVSKRTLHYYDEIDLLKPKAIRSNGYRIYGSEEVTRLQQILFFKSFGLSLIEIQTIMAQDKVTIYQTLQSQQMKLIQQKISLELYFAIEKCREMQLKMQRFATHLIPFRQCVGQSIALAMKRDDMGVMN